MTEWFYYLAEGSQYTEFFWSLGSNLQLVPSLVSRQDSKLVALQKHNETYT